MTHDEVTAAMKAEDVDPALVEKAKRGLIDAAIAEAPHLPVEAIAKAGAANLERTIRVILAAVVREIQAQALRDAADGMYDHRHTGCFKMQCPDCREVRVRADVRAYLKSRVARLTATTEGEA